MPTEKSSRPNTRTVEGYIDYYGKKVFDNFIKDITTNVSVKVGEIYRRWKVPVTLQLFLKRKLDFNKLRNDIRAKRSCNRLMKQLRIYLKREGLDGRKEINTRCNKPL